MPPFWVAAAMTIAVNASTNPPSLLCKLSGAIPIGYGRGTPLRVGLINLAREHLGWEGTAISVGVQPRVGLRLVVLFCVKPREVIG